MQDEDTRCGLDGWMEEGYIICDNLRLPHEMFFAFLFHRGNLRIGIFRDKELL